MIKMIKSTAFLILSHICLISYAYADTHLTYTDTYTNAPAKLNTIQIKAGKVRSQNEQSATYTLFDSQQNMLYTINTEKKQYTKVSLDEVKKIAQEAEQLQTQMREKITAEMANLPEEQRKVVEQRLANFEAQQKTPTPVVNAQKTQQSISVNNIPCEVYQVTIDGKPSRESCISTQAIPENDLKSLQAMFSFINQMSQYTAQIRGEKKPDFATLPSYSTGLAVRIQALPNGMKSELMRIQQADLDNDVFTIPSDYTLYSNTQTNSTQPQPPANAATK